MDDLPDSKREIRRQTRLARRALTDDDRDYLSDCIARHATSSPQFKRANSVACYLAMPEEVQAWAIIERAWRMRKRVFVPVIGGKSHMQFRRLLPATRLVRNRFGLLEPESGRPIVAQQLDLVFAPLVAFDKCGNRIGMGGGYYDRAFSFLRGRVRYRHPKLVGLAFACQQVEIVHASPWDIPLFQIYTENGAVIG